MLKTNYIWVVVRGSKMEQNKLLNYRIDKELIEINVDVNDWQSALERVSKLFMKKGYVKKGFQEALIAREKEFPTGIPLEDYGVALPHTDPKYINQTGVSIITLKNGVEFRRMDDSNETVGVNIIFGLAVENPQQHLHMLQQIIDFIQQKENLEKIMETNNPDELAEIINCKLI